MLGAGRPARVRKAVVDPLLNVVDDALFEIFRIISKPSDARHDLLDV